MNKEPTDVTNEVLRLVGEIITEKPQVAKAFAERLAGLLNKPTIKPFEMFGREGEAATRKNLGKLTNDQLFSIIYAYDFDADTIPLKSAKKPALIEHVVSHLKASFRENRQLVEG
ncbi:hypothetical protein [Hyphomicrobium sp.]|uniref:hypothetical protein n=1 Tax=Hyphomicrobium sp. TaxID=82 RepID=UPI001DB60850|nr:hypothetical protein [Hyphomicrobium sp.]MBY0558519.1 hypothetical protein [Hyphomicrobium sp.]